VTAYGLVPGAGGAAWYWHRVVPLLEDAGHRAVAIDLPAADERAGLTEYADVAVAALADVTEPLVVVAQSMGAFTAPLVAARLPATTLIVLVNPMTPAAGEAPGQWWSATGQDTAMPANLLRIGLSRITFDPVADFFHDVPDDVRAEAFAAPEPGQSDTPFEQPWPLSSWPDIPTRIIQGSDDRLFPLEFQRKLVRERLGLELDVLPGGHLMALSRPRDLAGLLLSYL
jgi:pimeloyl-ACP methyl ester carboxylesterase